MKMNQNWTKYLKQYNDLQKTERDLQLELTNIINENEDYHCFIDSICFNEGNIVFIVPKNKKIKYTTLTKIIDYLNCDECIIDYIKEFKKPYLGEKIYLKVTFKFKKDN